jgi:mono/diheme cytochrome c family protein
VRTLLCVLVLTPVACAPAGAVPAEPGAAPQAVDADQRAALYNRYCLPCHGDQGDGDGPAAPWLWPRPRDFTRGEFKWRSTASGSPPTRADLVRTISLGVPGTSMYGFASSLTTEQIAALADRVLELAGPTGRRPTAAEPVVVGPAPPVDDALVARGRQVWTDMGCAACHGAAGKGNGPAAPSLQTSGGLPSPPYDLTAMPLRRPGEAGLQAVYASLVTGLDGTPMPAYGGSVAEADLWAVAAYVDRIRYRGGPLPEPTSVDLLAVQTTSPATHPAGRWPGSPESPDARVWGSAIGFQGPPPANLVPAQTSLAPAQCGRCHAKQLREWKTSLHSQTASPGTIGQILRRDPAGKASCLRCHAPLPEQLEHAAPNFARSPLYDQALRDEGIACAGCHLRQWERLGPPRQPGSGVLAQPGYPVTELPIYERADFCLPCHQLPPWNVRLVAGSRDDRGRRKPLLNTYREWLEGPYMRRGIQCQHCHMPNREHTFLGVHDPDTFRQGVKLDVIAGRSPDTGTVSVRARLTNVGAAHYLPTTPTPAAWLSVALVDERRRPIAGAQAELRIGRHLRFDGVQFHEIEDTRIPPEQSIELARAWKDGRVDRARFARVMVRVAPDDYYQGLFEHRLATQDTSSEVRNYFEAALARTKQSRYIAIDRYVPIRAAR